MLRLQQLDICVTDKTFLNETVLSIKDPSNKYLLASLNYFFKRITLLFIPWKWIERNFTRIFLNAWKESWVSIKFINGMFKEHTSNKSSPCMPRQPFTGLSTTNKLYIILSCPWIFCIASCDLFHKQYNNQDGCCSLTLSNAENIKCWKQTIP